MGANTYSVPDLSRQVKSALPKPIEKRKTFTPSILAIQKCAPSWTPTTIKMVSKIPSIDTPSSKSIMHLPMADFKISEAASDLIAHLALTDGSNFNLVINRVCMGENFNRHGIIEFS